MSFIYRFLFPANTSGKAVSLFLLALRILFGGLFLYHGLQKWSNFSDLSAAFPDPLGVGSQLSLILAIFGEVICSFAFLGGILFRLAVIPMIVTMSVAFFIVHGNDPFAVKELAFIYLIVFVLMFLMGPGSYSVDRLIARIFGGDRKR